MPRDPANRKQSLVRSPSACSHRFCCRLTTISACFCCIRPSQGGTFGKLAVLTKDTKALADKVSASGGSKNIGGGSVLFAGAVPGIGTKVRTQYQVHHFRLRALVSNHYPRAGDDGTRSVPPASSSSSVGLGRRSSFSLRTFLHRRKRSDGAVVMASAKKSFCSSGGHSQRVGFFAARHVLWVLKLQALAKFGFFCKLRNA